MHEKLAPAAQTANAATATEATATEYLMGHSERELTRLAIQNEVIVPTTRRLLRRLGLRAGMHVLDIGCGTGETTELICEIVGPSGSYLGIDRSDVAIAACRKRFTAESNLRFEVATLEQLDRAAAFDVAFGRYVLMHQPEPAEMIRSAASRLRPGGTLAFHELVLDLGCSAAPPSPLWQRMNAYLVGAFRSGLQSFDVARELVAHFAAAGLPAPNMFGESPVGDADTSAITPWFVETLRTLAPAVTASFGVDASELELDTLVERLRAEGRDYRTQVFSPVQVAAWLSLSSDPAANAGTAFAFPT